MNKAKNNSQRNQKIMRENLDDFLTKEEIRFLKDSYKRRTLFDKGLEFEYNNLPPRKPDKKTNYTISEETFEEFEIFSNNISEKKRITRDDLVEMALRKFMRDFK
ncbi:hypothetical protein K0H71_17230 [Bacillus sp. IITD106]|nr:hypothetical protein [Bacillus sp. IITD106]